MAFWWMRKFDFDADWANGIIARLFLVDLEVIYFDK
jgi:hypothetical protein